MTQLTSLTKRTVLAALLTFAFCQAKADLYINEVSGNDKWIEIYNDGTSSVNISGYTIEKTDEEDVKVSWIIPSGTTIAAGGFLSWARNATNSFTWGISAKKDVTFKLFNIGGTLLNTFEIKEATTTLHSEGLSRTVGRKTDGGSELIVFKTGSRGKSNSTGTAQTPTPEGERKKLFVNEISGNEKWVEIYNAESEIINLSGYYLQKIDEVGEVDNLFFHEGATIKADSLRTWVQLDTWSFTWGISGKKDVAFKIFDPNGTELDYFEVKENLYSEGLFRTVGRKTDGADELVIFKNGGTRGKYNSAGTIQVPTPENERKKIYVNEISGNDKWLEICNAGTEEVDLTGYAIRKIDEFGAVDNWFIPAGTKIAPKGFLYWTQDETIYPAGFDKTTNFTFTWGISAQKDVAFKLFDQNGTELDYFEVREPLYSFGDKKTVGRIPDATGDPKVLLVGTQGATNQNNISVDEVDIENELRANVSNKILYLSDNVTDVSIFSILGITVTSQNNLSGGVINLSALPSGVYLIKLSDGKHQKIQKIRLN